MQKQAANGAKTRIFWSKVEPSSFPNRKTTKAKKIKITKNYKKLCTQF
jgi:hypothetical protein